MTRQECGPAMLRMKILLSSGTSTISNPGALKNDGPGDALQSTSGESFEKVELRYSYTALAQGWKGTSFERGKPPRPGLTSQYPLLAGVDPRFTLPSGQRGVPWAHE